jgi:hypothetical protein
MAVTGLGRAAVLAAMSLVVARGAGAQTPTPTDQPSEEPSASATPTVYELSCDEDRKPWAGMVRCTYDAHFEYTNVAGSCERLWVEDPTDPLRPPRPAGVRVSCAGTVKVTFDDPLVTNLITTTGDECKSQTITPDDESTPSYTKLVCADTVPPITVDLSLHLPITYSEKANCDDFEEGSGPTDICKKLVTNNYYVESPLGDLYLQHVWKQPVVCCVPLDYQGGAPSPAP